MRIKGYTFYARSLGRKNASKYILKDISKNLQDQINSHQFYITDNRSRSKISKNDLYKFMFAMTFADKLAKNTRLIRVAAKRIDSRNKTVAKNVY